MIANMLSRRAPGPKISTCELPSKETTAESHIEPISRIEGGSSGISALQFEEIARMNLNETT